MLGYHQPPNAGNSARRVPAEHPIWLINQLAEIAPEELSSLFRTDVQRSPPAGRFSRVVADGLALAGVVRSGGERMFCRQLDYHILFRCFLALNSAEQASATPSVVAIRGGYWSATWRPNFPHGGSGDVRAEIDRRRAY